MQRECMLIFISFAACTGYTLFVPLSVVEQESLYLNFLMSESQDVRVVLQHKQACLSLPLRSERPLIRVVSTIQFLLMIPFPIPPLFNQSLQRENYQKFLPRIFTCSSKRNINFRINIFHNIEPIFVLSYKMTPTNLKEMKDYLKDLLNKGLI